jgi:uncharacterized membrane protein
MFTRFVTLWETVRTSLWALPLAMVLIACGLAYAALTISFDLGDDTLWFLFSGSGKQAPQFLSSLMTAMITMATLAISITMVVLTLAAQQLGPRLIRNFIGDRRTQLALGMFFGTVIYLVLVLRSAYGTRNSVPSLAVSVGTLLVLVCVVTLVLFVHHLARSIISDNVVERVGGQLDASITRLLPEETERQPAVCDFPARPRPVSLSHGGYVQAIDFNTVAEAAARTQTVVEFVVRAGHHVISGAVVACIRPQERAGETLCRTVREALVLGSERTTVQDLEFSIRQLVEIALRALSPGINDLYTALAVINRLTLSIRNIMVRGTPKSIWRDAGGDARVVAQVSTFEGILDGAFNQIRQNAANKPAVLIRMAESIGQLLQQAEPRHRDPLEEHLRLVLEEGRRSIAEPRDFDVLQKRVETARQAADGTARPRP